MEKNFVLIRFILFATVGVGIEINYFNCAQVPVMKHSCVWLYRSKHMPAAFAGAQMDAIQTHLQFILGI